MALILQNALNPHHSGVVVITDLTKNHRFLTVAELLLLYTNDKYRRIHVNTTSYTRHTGIVNANLISVCMGACIGHLPKA